VTPPVRSIAVVPDVPALRPEFASIVDPVPELRAAVAAAVASADRVVRLNGSARRTHASPGPFDERAVAFDEHLLAALRGPDIEALHGVDRDLARELWADVEALGELAELLAGHQWTVQVEYDDAPYGVAWWVITYADAVR